MDFKVSKKETRSQPDGMFDILVTDVFDLYPILEGNVILDAEIIEDDEELIQNAMIATIRQRGVDPIEPYRGVRWAQVLLGELMSDALLVDIQAEAKMVSVYVSVIFDTYISPNGESFLSYSIKVVK